MTTDLHDRLAGLSVEMAPETAERHLVEIRRELRSPGPAVVRPPRRRRRLAVVLAAIGLLLLPAAAAIAAEDAVPGDLLYPVKRTTEWVRSVIDSDIDTVHRIEELETVLDRHAPVDVVTDRLSDADAAVTDHLEHLDRLARARDRIATDYQGGPGTDAPATDDPAGADPDGEGPAPDRERDQSGSDSGDHSTTTVAEHPTDTTVPTDTTTTTVGETHRNEPPPRDRRGDG